MDAAQNTLQTWVDFLCRRADYEKAVTLLGDHIRRFPADRWAEDLLERVRRKAHQVELVASLDGDLFDEQDADFLDDLDEAGDEWSLEEIEPAVSSKTSVAEVSMGQDQELEVPESCEEDLEAGGQPTGSEFDASELDDLIPADGDEWADLDGTVSEVEFEALTWEEGDDPTLPVDPEVQGSGRIELGQRARSAAARLIPEVEWLRRDLPLLQEILAHHQCNTKTIAALRSVIPLLDVMPSELRTAFKLRIYWSECDHLHRGWNSHGELAAVTWQNISWGLSLAIVRRLVSDDIDEISDWLESCFEDWNKWHVKGRYHPTFHSYLVFLLNHLDAQEEVIGHKLPSYLDFDLFSHEEDSVPGSLLWRAIDDFGLFPKNTERRCAYTESELAGLGANLPAYVFTKGKP